MVKRIIEWGATCMIMVLDDYGYKQGLFMSPNNYRTYVIPWINQICKTAHKADLKVFLHSCGDFLPIFEDLVKAGVDIFHPIEPTTAAWYKEFRVKLSATTEDGRIGESRGPWVKYNAIDLNLEIPDVSTPSSGIEASLSLRNALTDEPEEGFVCVEV